jgi:hypothetical protein
MSDTKAVLTNGGSAKGVSGSVKEKFQNKRRVMKEIRGNQCSAKTLDHVDGLPPQLQQTVVKQLAARLGQESKESGNREPATKKKVAKRNPAAKPKTKPNTKPTRKATAKKDETPVTQSTSDTESAIASAKQSLFESVFEKTYNDILLNDTKLDPGVRQQMLDIAQTPELQSTMNEMKQQFFKCIRSMESGGIGNGAIPDITAIQNFVQDIMQNYKKINPVPSTRTFNHDEPQPITTKSQSASSAPSAPSAPSH